MTEPFKAFEQDQILCKYVKYFQDLKRNPETYLRESEIYYKDVSKRERPIYWLCDKSGHHTDRFLASVERYENAFEHLRTHSSMVLICPIWEEYGNKERDHIFGDIKNIEGDKYFTYRIKYEQWRDSTRKGILNKIEYMLANPIRKITGVKTGLNRRYQDFLLFNKNRLVDYDTQSRTPYFCEFQTSEDGE